MNIDKKRMKRLQYLGQIACYTLGQGAGNPCVDTYDFHMWYTANIFQKAMEVVVIKQQGVAAGQDYVPNFCMLSNITNAGLNGLSGD